MQVCLVQTIPLINLNSDDNDEDDPMHACMLKYVTVYSEIQRQIQSIAIMFF